MCSVDGVLASFVTTFLCGWYKQQAYFYPLFPGIPFYFTGFIDSPKFVLAKSTKKNVSTILNNSLFCFIKILFPNSIN